MISIISHKHFIQFSKATNKVYQSILHVKKLCLAKKVWLLKAQKTDLGLVRLGKARLA
jgi:hypothetical protein